MKKIVLLFMISSLTIYSLNNKKIRVIEIDSAMRINRGYVVLNSDSVFEFNSDKYLIKTREFFDENGEISHATIWSEMGYEYYPKKNLFEIKHFLDDYNLSRFIQASLVDGKHIKINSDIGLINSIDKRGRVIYYSLNGDKNSRGLVYLHRLIYQ